MQQFDLPFAFGEWFDQRFGDKPQRRGPSWKAALGIFLQRRGRTIVETGCQRHRDDWGAGCSTHIFGLMLRAHGRGQLYSVDNSRENLETALGVVQGDGTADLVKFYLGDSVHFLHTFREPIDLLYLDSWDYRHGDPDPSQHHQLKELVAAYKKLSPGAVVLLDDNDLVGGGKTKLAKSFLSAQGWLSILDCQQSAWIRG